MGEIRECGAVLKPQLDAKNRWQLHFDRLKRHDRKREATIPDPRSPETGISGLIIKTKSIPQLSAMAMAIT